MNIVTVFTLITAPLLCVTCAVILRYNSATFLYFKGTEQKLDFLEPNEILKVYRNIFDKPLEEIPEDAREFIQECRDFVKDFKNKINENN